MTMRKKDYIRISLAAIALAVSASCAENEDDENYITVTLNQIVIDYDDDGVWVDAYQADTRIVYENVVFSHAGYGTYWSGFVASRNSDNNDYSDGDWLEHQFTSMSAGGISGDGTPYLVAYWNTTEELGDDPSCSIAYTDSEKLFTPISAFVNNTSYSYYAMKNGTEWSSKFAAGDYCVLQAYGITQDDEITGPAELYLAEYTADSDSPVSQWTYFNFEELGVVKSLFFRMESSDSGDYGMNNPAYFAMDRMSMVVEE